MRALTLRLARDPKASSLPLVASRRSEAQLLAQSAEGTRHTDRGSPPARGGDVSRTPRCAATHAAFPPAVATALRTAGSTATSPFWGTAPALRSLGRRGVGDGVSVVPPPLSLYPLSALSSADRAALLAEHPVPNPSAARPAFFHRGKWRRTNRARFNAAASEEPLWVSDEAARDLHIAPPPEVAPCLIQCQAAERYWSLDSTEPL